jgi:predicted aspartyl protease
LKIALIAGTVASPAGACTMNLVAQLPLVPLGADQGVTVQLNHQPAKLIFDTGSFTSVLTLEATKRLGIPNMRSEEKESMHATLYGIGGGRSAIGVTAHSVEIGGLHAKDYNFIAADVVPPPADGLLSIDLLSNYDIDLDLPEQQVRLFRPTGDCSAPAAFLSSPLYAVPLLPNGEDRRPRIKVTVGGTELIAVVDTGAYHSAILRGAADRLGLTGQAVAADAQLTISGIGPREVGAVRHVLTDLSVGDLTFANMPIDVLQARGDDEVQVLLGADFQRKVHVWVSYSSHTLILQYPPLPSKKLGGS